MANEILGELRAKTRADVESQNADRGTLQVTETTSLEALAAEIVADAKVSPSTYLLRSDRGHDGE